MSVPGSIITICAGVRLNKRYEHTIYWENEASRYAYFVGKRVKEFSAYTYLRKSWSIKVEATMGQARSWDYLFFSNPDNAKTYYYFINNVEYINDSTVELFLELDVMTTYFFDYSISPSYVVREHVALDVKGAWNQDEGLDVGDYWLSNPEDIPLNDLCILIQATFDPLTTTAEYTAKWGGGMYANQFSGLGVFATNFTANDSTALATKMSQLDTWGKSDGIINMWMYPRDLVRLNDDDSWTNGNVTHYVSTFDGEVYHYITPPANIGGGYVPRNNRLYSYPFNFIYATNNNGASAVYKYERFGDPTQCGFKVVGSTTPEGVIKMYPLNYGGITHNWEEGISLAGFPTCGWNQDTYKLWLAQNQNQHQLNSVTAGARVAAGVVGGVASLATGNLLGAATGAGAAISGATQIAELNALKADKEIQPPQAKGQSVGNISLAHGFMTFSICQKSVTPEFARVIDDFFDLYGYSIKRVKIPNRNVRENWCYTKTIGCHVDGNIPNDDLTTIEAIYDKGITFWKNPDKIGDYTLSNACVEG